MIEHVSVTEFVDRFGAIDRAENFSIPARRALFAYFEKLEDGAGEELEFDALSICCEWTEY